MLRRAAVLLAFLTTGCSTAPLADLLDWVHPGKLEKGQFHGGVEPAPPIPAPGAPPVVVPVVPAAPPGPPPPPVGGY